MVPLILSNRNQTIYSERMRNLDVLRILCQRHDKNQADRVSATQEAGSHF